MTKGSLQSPGSLSHTGLDEGQVTCWNSWMRWSLFSLIAAVLALTVAATATYDPVVPARLIPLTCPELVRPPAGVRPDTTRQGSRARPALDGLAPTSGGRASRGRRSCGCTGRSRRCSGRGAVRLSGAWPRTVRMGVATVARCARAGNRGGSLLVPMAYPGAAGDQVPLARPFRSGRGKMPGIGCRKW